MKEKDRVIVIDLVGEDEQSVVQVGVAGSHECSCAVCTCDKEYRGEQLELDLQLQMHEFSAPGSRRAEKSVLPAVLPEFGELIKEYLSKD